MSKKKLFGNIAKIAMGFVPGGKIVEMGGDLLIGEFLMKDDKDKELYRKWYKLAKLLGEQATLQSGLALTNAGRRTILESFIENSLFIETGEWPSETELGLAFFTVVNDVKGNFEDDNG